MPMGVTEVHSFTPDIYIAPLQETYSEALSVQLQSKRNDPFDPGMHHDSKSNARVTQVVTYYSNTVGLGINRIFRIFQRNYQLNQVCTSWITLLINIYMLEINGKLQHV